MLPSELPSESIDERCRAEFEAAWWRGSPVSIEGCLPDVAQGSYLATLEELVCIELEFTWKRWSTQTSNVAKDAETAAQPCGIETYLQRFPELDRPEIVRRLLREEFFLRHRYGDGPKADDQSRRFPSVYTSHLSQAFGEHSFESASERGRDPFEDHQFPLEIGDFRIVRKIGQGGMGVVYEAEQLSLSRRVALKLLPDRRDNANWNEFIHREARLTAALDHPNIVSIYEVGEFDGRPYFAMKYIQGVTLAEHLETHGALRPRAAVQMMIPIVRAIARAHRSGLLHRDIKPSNILMDTDGVPHVADFGLAISSRHEESMEEFGSLIGTPCYMSPEQAAGSDATAQSDVYGIGTVLYQMLTGQPPFVAETSAQTVLMVLEQTPVSPRQQNEAINPVLDRVVLSCLQKDPDLRYESADALADDLEAYLHDEPMSVRLKKPGDRFARIMGETQYGETLLQDWGGVWMVHACVLLVLCLLTFGLWHAKLLTHLALFGVWLASYPWSIVFWKLRGPDRRLSFIERQIAHLWMGANISCGFILGLEALLRLPPLTLAPLMALVGGTVFLLKASLLSGAFYLPAMGFFLAAPLMVWWPQWQVLVLGGIAWASLFPIGLKYLLLRQESHLQK